MAHEFTRIEPVLACAQDWHIIDVTGEVRCPVFRIHALREKRSMMHLEQRFIQALHVLRHHRLHAPHRSAHEVYQSSTINALLEGVYDGDMTCGQLRRHGDFGIGTFNALDGEMIGFDGHFWQIRGDGRVHPVPDAYKTPFATVL
jgi:acetolactate decarboxylase